MTIDFIWIESYGIIKKMGLNFNPNFTYLFDNEKHILTKQENNKLPSDFFSINENTVQFISAIVGANGTGKSSILEFICQMLVNSVNNISGILVTSIGIINRTDFEIKLSNDWIGIPISIHNKLDIVNNLRRQEGREIFTDQQDYKTWRGFNILDNFVKDTRLIYYSGEVNLEHTTRIYQSLLSLTDEFENSYFTDLSDMSMMSRDQQLYSSDKAVYSGENPILTYRAGESKRFMDLLLEGYMDYIPFNMDNLLINISFNDNDKTFYESYDQVAFIPLIEALISILNSDKDFKNKKLIKFLEELKQRGFGQYLEEKLHYHKKDYKNSFTISFLHHVLLRYTREKILQSLGELSIDQKFSHFLAFLNEFEKSFNNESKYSDQILDYFKKSEFLNNQVGTIEINVLKEFCFKCEAIPEFNGERFLLRLDKSDELRSLSNLLNELSDSSELLFDILSIFDFDIRGLSTGERQFLKIISRFINHKLNNQITYQSLNTFIILLDEFEIGFHPEWQRKFIKLLIDFFEKFINIDKDNKKIKVQIIITSHSPFVVSDLPRECINFLKKSGSDVEVENYQKHHRTFGANLHQLYGDSFFLEGALIGDFAKAKIDRLFEMLFNSENVQKSEEIEYVINSIGEPLIREKLKDVYNYRLNQ